VESLAFFAICREHHSTMRESPFVRSLPRHLPWAIGLAVVMAVIGPFGSYNYMGLGSRLVYFAVVGLSFWLVITLLAALLGSLDWTERWPVPFRMAVAGFLSAVPGTLVIFLVHGWLVQPVPIRFAPQIFTESAFLAVILSVVIGLFVDWRLHAEADLERARVAAVAKPVPEPAPPATDFFRRIPPALGRELLALQTEDHYLRIHTKLGSDLILLRLRDALAELGPERGRQVHRSWWVADGAVASIERNAARTFLVLHNGLRVPVSKSFRDQVKEAGWLS
jgi:hypothetical protein